MKELQIDGNTISVVEKKIVHTTTIDAFLETLAKTQSINTGILPSGCKLLFKAQGGKTSVYVIERHPGITALAFHEEKHRASTVKDIKLSLPFIQFYVALTPCPKGYAFQGVFTSCTKIPLMHMEDPVFVLPLPNIFDRGEGKVCTGDISVSMGSPAQICEELVSAFFSAPSNLDLSAEYPREISVRNDHKKSLEAWQEKSEGNPLFGISKEITYNQFSSCDKSTLDGRIKNIISRLNRD